MVKKKKVTNKKIWKKILFIIIIPLILSLILTKIIIGKFNIPIMWKLIFFMLSFMIFLIIISLLFNKDVEEYRFNIKLWLKILMLIVFAGQLIIFSLQLSVLEKQTEIFNKQTDILNPTPRIILWTANSPLSLPVSDKNTHFKLAVGATNLGEILIPHARINIEENEYFKFAEFDDLDYHEWEIMNLESFDWKDEWLGVSIKDNLSAGIYPIKIKVVCAICRNPIEIQKINVCFYEHSENRDCGEDWWIKNEP